MCLGIPAQVTAIDEGHADLVEVDMAGVRRMINVGVLDDGQSPAVGDWLLVHMGFALAIISAEEARDALEVFEDERTAAAALMGSQEDR
ncbi:MAG TPA: HypC/HybG/HupF family hydrogenase formation chaperone [Micromonosporaceae bacterium]|jgi:hydrogenase expression/formation protein HypC